MRSTILPETGDKRGIYTVTGVEKRGRLWHICLTCPLGHKTSPQLYYYRAITDKKACVKCGITARYPSEYQCWRNFKSRCLDSNHKQYADYGGRGIDVAPAWIDSFAQFLSDVGKKPSPELSLDRINNDLGYHPHNVRWATRREQTQNTRPRVLHSKAPHDWVYEQCWELLAA